jgi:hypothetical protein
VEIKCSYAEGESEVTYRVKVNDKGASVWWHSVDNILGNGSVPSSGQLADKHVNAMYLEALNLFYKYKKCLTWLRSAISGV